jgi:hypothetical protein
VPSLQPGLSHCSTLQTQRALLRTRVQTLTVASIAYTADTILHNNRSPASPGGTVAIEIGVAGYATERAWLHRHCEPFSGGLSRDGTSMSGNKDAAARASVDLLELSRLAWEARKDGARVLMSACGAHFG